VKNKKSIDESLRRASDVLILFNLNFSNLIFLDLLQLFAGKLEPERLRATYIS